MLMKTTSLITITLIAGVILLVTGTSIEMAFADANTRGPGQSGANPGQSGGGPPLTQPNPGNGLPTPGQLIGAIISGQAPPPAGGGTPSSPNPGQCGKFRQDFNMAC